VKNVRLPGFRPGKVPMKVMRQRFGAGVRQEVLGEVMSRSFQEAVVQEQAAPAGNPTIEPRNTEAGKDLEYVATFEVFPEITVKSNSRTSTSSGRSPRSPEKTSTTSSMCSASSRASGRGRASRRRGRHVSPSTTVGTRDGEALRRGQRRRRVNWSSAQDA
jgi:trigger factor